MVKEYNFCNI